MDAKMTRKEVEEAIVGMEEQLSGLQDYL